MNDNGFIKTPEYNRWLLLNLIRSHGTLSQLRLRKMLGLHHATASKIFNELQERKLIVTHGKKQAGKPGRPEVLVKINPKLGWFIGVGRKFGATYIVHMDVAGHIFYRESMPTVDDLKTQLQAVHARYVGEKSKLEIEHGPLLGVGLAVPGIVDSESGKWLYCVNKDTERVRDASELLYDLFQTQTWVDNNTRSAARAEIFWRFKDNVSEFLFLEASLLPQSSSPTCIILNSSIIIDNNVRHGGTHTAGELSGRFGPNQLIKITRDNVIELNSAPNDMTRESISIIEWLSDVISSAADFCGTSMAVLGGELNITNEHTWSLLNERVRDKRIPTTHPDSQVISAHYAQDGVAVGAAAGAMHKVNLLDL